MKATAYLLALSLMATSSAFAQRILEDARISDGYGNVVLDTNVSIRTEAELKKLIDTHDVVLALPVQNYHASLGGVAAVYDQPIASEVVMAVDANQNGEFVVSGKFGAGWMLYNHDNRLIGFLGNVGLNIGIDENLDEKGGLVGTELGLRFVYFSPETKIQIGGTIGNNNYSKNIDRYTIARENVGTNQIKASIEQDILTKYVKLVADGSISVGANGQLTDGKLNIGTKFGIVNDLVWLDVGVAIKQNPAERVRFYIGTTIR